jgi:O-succinylbenzoic acid--CoA ligase
MNYLRLNDQKLEVDDFLNTTHQAANLKFISQFLDKWFKLTETYSFSTSGSTGPPKSIWLSRKQLRYSAESTLCFLGISQSRGEALMVLPPDRIGGIMLLVRCLVSDLDIHVVNPTSDFSFVESEYKLTSMTPYQVNSLVNNHSAKLNHFENMLIGGGPMPAGLESILLSKAQHVDNWYHTYGMTETASHVALRRLGTKEYRAIGDATFEVDQRSCLVIKGTVTDNIPLITNDIVEIIDSHTFHWKGRADFVINTGGVKVNPEEVEQQLSGQLGESRYFITSIPDQKLGQKVVLLIEGGLPVDQTSIDLTEIDRYARPKAIYLLPEFAYTDAGKLDRIETTRMIQRLGKIVSLSSKK